MDHFEDQTDMFEDTSVKTKAKPKITKDKSIAQIVSMTNLGDAVLKPRPYRVVRVNPTTVYILHD